MYLIGTYQGHDGDRQVLLMRLPSNHEELAIVDVPGGPAPLNYAEIHIVSREVKSLRQGIAAADDHLARSAHAGEPATGDDYLSDAARIVSVQGALRERTMSDLAGSPTTCVTCVASPCCK